MYSGKLALTNPRGVPFSVSNEFKDTFLFSEAVAECQSAEEVLNTARDFCEYNYRMSVDSDNAKYTRIVFKDAFGNTHYLLAYKDSQASSRLAGISDDELIAELERRGYQVV